jgi:hypothetical protein
MKPSDVLWKRYQTRIDDDISVDDTIRRRIADQLHEDYLHLEHRIERLPLISRAMWELFTDKTTGMRGSSFQK